MTPIIYVLQDTIALLGPTIPFLAQVATTAPKEVVMNQVLLLVMKDISAITK